MYRFRYGLAFTLAALRGMIPLQFVSAALFHRALRTRFRRTFLASAGTFTKPDRNAAETAAPPAQARHRLETLLRVRLRKFMGLLPVVLAEDDPEPVHDLRVWSRRLQQVVVTLCPDPRPEDARKMVRALKRARRALGGWRDCDVMLELLDRRLRRIPNPAERSAWQKAREWTAKRRERAMRQARRKLASRKLFTLGQCARRVADEAWPEGDDTHRAGADPAAILATAVREAYGQWRQALVRARDTLTFHDIHAFRIQTKRLRYRIELVRDLGDKEAGEALSALRGLQDGLGRWHDHGELTRVAAEALADPAFLLEQPRVAGIVLRKLARDNAAEAERVRDLIEKTTDGLDTSPLDAWINRLSASPATVDSPSR